MKKKKATIDDDDAPLAPLPKVGTSMKSLLGSVKIDPNAKKTAPKPIAPTKKSLSPRKPAPTPITTAPIARPSDSLRGHDRTAFYDAMAGVRGLHASATPQRATGLKLPPAPPAAETREEDRVARARLAALVSGGLHYEIRRDDEWLAGVRRDAPRGTLETLSGATPSDDASLDLHGARAGDVEPRVLKFVRQAQRRGLRRVRVVHGKGLHSDAAGPVLGDALIEALTRGSAASIVLAFVTAPASQGGSGALLVELSS